MAAGGLCARCGDAAAAAPVVADGGGKRGRPRPSLPPCLPLRGRGGQRGVRRRGGAASAEGGLTAAGPAPAWPRPRARGGAPPPPSVRRPAGTH